MRHGTLFSSALTLALLSGTALSSTAAFAEEAAAADAADAGGSGSGTGLGEDIVVIGTRRSGLTELTSPVPIDIVGNEALENSGTVGLAQSLRTLVPSINFSQTGGPIGAQATQSVALRGASPGQTLVLVNGKRRHLSARITTGTQWGRGAQPVDVNTIPQVAVSRVEVLRDGASAYYGSDAIGGVVNIVLRGDEPGGGLNATYGQFYEGDGKSRNIDGWYTFGLKDRGFLSASFGVRKSDRTNRDNLDARQYYFAGDPREATVDREVGLYGNPIVKSATFALNGEYEITDALTLYGFATYDGRTTNVIGVRIRPFEDLNVRSLFPDGTQTKLEYHYKDFDGIAGLRYDLGDSGQIDLSSGYGINSIKQYLLNGQNASYGVLTPTDFYTGRYISSQSSTQLDYSNDIEVGYSSHPLTLSAGLAYRWESFEIRRGDVASYADGGQVIVGGPNAGKRPAPGANSRGLGPEDEGRYTRNVYSAYVGAEQQLTDRFQIGLAGRFEKSSDFGSTATGKISSRYDFTDSIALRGSVSNGTRAPSLGQIGASSTAIAWIYPATAPAYTAAISFLPVNSEVAKAFGAKPLKPEKSFNISAGLVLRPLDGLSVTIDAYQTRVRDGLSQIDNLTGAWFDARFAALFGNNPNIPTASAVRFFTNALRTRTRGLDFVTNYNTDLGGGKLGLSFSANFNTVKITGVAANPPELAGSGLTLIGRQSRAYVERWAPKNKLFANLDYAIGRFNVNLSEVRYGSYWFTGAQAIYDQKFRPQYVTNLAVTYAVTDSVKLTIGANNLFDGYPERPIPADRYNGFNNYDLQAPEGGNGGFYYASIRTRF